MAKSNEIQKVAGSGLRGPGVESSTAEDADRIETQANANAVSRAIAVIILMILPGIAGGYLDKWLGTKFFVVIGFAIGTGIAIYGLLYVARIADLAAKKSRDLRKPVESSETGKSESGRHESGRHESGGHESGGHE